MLDSSYLVDLSRVLEEMQVPEAGLTKPNLRGDLFSFFFITLETGDGMLLRGGDSSDTMH